MTLGQKLRQRRESLGLTRLQVARACDVVESTVINWETDRHTPKLYPAQMKALCDTLKFTLEDLVDWERMGFVDLDKAIYNKENQKAMNLATELMKLRKRLGLTQKQVAEAVGVTDQTVSNWEAGRFEPKLTISQTQALCRILKCSLDELPSFSN